MTLKEFGHRRLRAHQGGLWFVALTVLVGLVAMTSGNNVLYVIECFLLAVFMVSGVVSEFFIRNVTVTFYAKGSFAGQRARDRWVICNNSRLPIFALSVGFKIQKKFMTHARVVYLGPRQTVTVESSHTYVSRGPFRADALFVQTDAPFGFASKIRFDQNPVERLVWAAPTDRPARNRLVSMSASSPTPLSSQRAHRQGQEILFGELGEGDESVNTRDIVWSQSFRMGDDVKVKLKSQDDHLQNLVLDQRPGSKILTETQISHFTKTILLQKNTQLKVLQERRTFCLESSAAFDFLAQLPPGEAA